jgi:polysaccharide export outer membrane protein
MTFGGIMGWIYRRVVVLVLMSLLAACSVPRGAGFQQEVLAASDKTAADGSAVYDFAVFEVTRDSMAFLSGWPVAAPNYQWIDRQGQPASLIISPGDTLTITIWDAEENSLLTSPGQRSTPLQDARVASDGRIFLPFVGEMKVSGMSPQTARSQIEARLAETAPSAQVQLSVVPGRGNTVNLVSGVRNPGVYPLDDRDVTLLGAISAGGGVLSSLTNPQVRLMRGNKIYGNSVARLFDTPRLDTTLRGGDQVIIEAEERRFLSLGAAGREAIHIFPTDQVTALEALSIIGGISDTRADPQGILILREYDAGATRTDGAGPPMQRVVFTLDLTSADGLFSAGNFQIMPDDLVYATESPIGAARTIFGLLATALTLENRL